jgi:hypothetical protein
VTYADAVTERIRRIVRDETADFHSGTVDTVNADGTVDVQAHDGLYPSVRCMSPYSPRDGDTVIVHRDARGNRITYGPAAAVGDGWLPVTLSGTWVHNGGGTDPVPAARVRADGTFQLSGQIKGTAVAAGATVAVGTVPAAALPMFWCRGAVVTSLAQGTAVITVNPGTGAISLVNGAIAATATTWFQIDVTGRGR